MSEPSDHKSLPRSVRWFAPWTWDSDDQAMLIIMAITVCRLAWMGFDVYRIGFRP